MGVHELSAALGLISNRWLGSLSGAVTTLVVIFPSFQAQQVPERSSAQEA